MAFIFLAVCVFYYNSQFDYFYYSGAWSKSDLIPAYLYYYFSIYLALTLILLILHRYPYRGFENVSITASNRASTVVFACLALSSSLYVIDLASFVSSSRPAMTDYGYLVGMLLFVSSFISFSNGYRILGMLQMILLLFLSKLLFFLVIIYFICINERLKGKYFIFAAGFCVALFLAWGLYQDNMNYDDGSTSRNQFLAAEFFFNHVIEGGRSIVTQIEMKRSPDFGVSFILSGFLRFIPGSFLREYGIRLIPEGISQSIVISGVESAIIHFGFLAPIFFTTICCLLFLKFNTSRRPIVKFVSCVSLFFFLRSGSYSFINNFVVLMVLFFLYMFINFAFIFLAQSFPKGRLSHVA